MTIGAGAGLGAGWSAGGRDDAGVGGDGVDAQERAMGAINGLHRADSGHSQWQQASLIHLESYRSPKIQFPNSMLDYEGYK